MKYSLLMLVSALALLAGCSGKINAVKNAPSLEPNFTIEQALADKNCQSSDWTTLKDANGRELVEYSCSYRLEQSSIDRIKQDEAKRLDNLEGLPAMTYKLARKDLEEILSKIDNEPEQRVVKQINETESALANLRGSSPEIAPLTSRNSESDLQNFLASLKGTLAHLQTETKETRAKYEPILVQVAGFESKFSATLQSMSAQDHKLLEGISAENHKLEHKIHFVANETGVARVAYGFFIDGEQIEVNSYWLQQMARAIESPNNRAAAATWWTTTWPKLNFSLQNFPYHCNYEDGCVEVKR